MARRVETTEQRQRRMAVWNHNGLRGCAAMMRQHCKRVYLAPTATREAKDLAMQINALATQLESALAERADPPPVTG